MIDIYDGLDPRDIPTYPISKAARYLKISPSTVRAWVAGKHYQTVSGKRFFEPVISIPDEKPKLLSFTNLVEVHVLRAIRKYHKITLGKVRDALNFIDEKLRILHPLAHKEFHTDGVDLFVEHCGELINASQKEHLKESLNVHLKRIELDEHGLAIKLYPFTQAHEENNPRLIVIDPRVAFGRSVIQGTGIPTSILAERYQAGDSIEYLAEDYGCDHLAIEEAIRCELSNAA